MGVRYPQLGASPDRNPGDRPIVLLVDDEPGPRDSLRMILAPACETRLAASGSRALELLRSAPVDLVTIDLDMPGMNGAELIRTVREEFPAVGIIVITGRPSVESAVEGIRLGVHDYLTKPFDTVAVLAAVRRGVGEIASRRRLVDFLETIGEVLGRQRGTSAMIGDLEHNSELQARLRAVLTEPALGSQEPSAAPPHKVDSFALLEVLAEAIEQRDRFMLGHGRRVAHYGAQISAAMGLDDEERELVRIACFLHDIGKVGVATDVVRSRELLGAEDREEIRKHAELGERLARPLGLPSQVESAIRHHHERWDGAGYPDGLAGDAIPLEARIVAVADAFDAITCSRPHQPARDEFEALAELRKEAGRQFDPAVVHVLAGSLSKSAAALAYAEEET